MLRFRAREEIKQPSVKISKSLSFIFASEEDTTLKFTGFVNFNVLFPFVSMFISKKAQNLEKLLDGPTPV